MRIALIILALFAFCACSDDPLPTQVEPSPSPSASPSPDPSSLCEISRTSITFERTDPQKPNPPIVTSWPRGIVPIAHARPVYRHAGDPNFDADACEAFDRVRWWCTGGSTCEFIGDQTAPDIYLKINQGGLHCVRAQALDLTEFGEACVSVVG